MAEKVKWVSEKEEAEDERGEATWLKNDREEGMIKRSKIKSGSEDEKTGWRKIVMEKS